MSVRYPCGPNAPAGRRAERASAPARHSSPLPASLACHARPFVGVFQKSIYKRTRQLLAINAHRMAPRTTRWLQERQGDAPTKGLAWLARHAPCHTARFWPWISGKGPSNDSNVLPRDSKAADSFAGIGSQVKVFPMIQMWSLLARKRLMVSLALAFR